MDDRDLHLLQKGRRLHNRYTIEGILGEGGFGITYKGKDEILNVAVAIKEYYPHGIVVRNNVVNDNITCTNVNQEEFFEKGKEKFLSEAQILARFNNQDGIVNVIDFFEANKTAYIVMEYLQGITLKDFIQQNGPIDPEDLLNLSVPILEALDEIHKHGLIHRDISPDNIMLLQNGRVKLMDFGAARNYTEFGEKSLSIVLKHGYAPEEQYRTRGIQGPWTDIYAYSATMYKCLSGITPDESIERVIEDHLKSLSELGVSLPASMEYTIMKGLAVRREDRYQNLRDFCRDLYGDYEEGGLTNQRSFAKDQPAYGGSSTKQGSANQGSKKIFAIGGALAAVVLILVIAVVFGLGNKGKSDPKKAESQEETSQEKVSEAQNGDTAEPEQEPDKKEGEALTLSDELGDYTFSLDGAVYQLPFPYKTFTDLGWKFSYYDDSLSEDTELEAGGYESFQMTNGKKEISVEVYNPSKNVAAIKDGYLCSIRVETRDDLDFAIAKGINCKSGESQIKEAFGTPSNRTDNSNYTSLSYYPGDSSMEGMTYFFLDGSDSSNNTIEVSHRPEKIEGLQEAEVKDEVPAYLSAYKAPAALSDKPTDTVFMLEKKLYQLPCPLSEFIDAGWELASVSEETLGAQNTNSFAAQITKDGHEIELGMGNFSKTECYLKNCAVTKVVFSVRTSEEDWKGDDVKLSGGLNLDTKSDDADGLLKGFDKNESGDSVTYSYYDTDHSISLYYSWDNNPAFPYNYFSIENEEWNY